MAEISQFHYAACVDVFANTLSAVLLVHGVRYAEDVQLAIRYFGGVGLPDALLHVVVAGTDQQKL